jgi:hypothetical protein
MADDGLMWAMGAVAALVGISAVRRRGSAALGKGSYPFAAKQAQYRGYTLDQLTWAANDAREARDAMRGWNPEAEAWYADDVSTILTELNKRKG